MSDPREKALIDASIAVYNNYDPHCASPHDRIVYETRLFLARSDALQSYHVKAHQQHTADMDAVNQIAGGTVTLTPAWTDVGPPIPMILFCPGCGMQHIDAAEDHKPDCNMYQPYTTGPFACNCGAWTNPPHRTHLCAKCGHLWRPADVTTNGVAEIATQSDLAGRPPIRGQMHGYLPAAQAGCMFIRCPSPYGCDMSGCRHPRQALRNWHRD